MTHKLAEVHAVAVSALLAADRRRLSLVDCCSFQIMRRLGIRQALAYDQHFAEHGFEVIGGFRIVGKKIVTAALHLDQTQQDAATR